MFREISIKEKQLRKIEKHDFFEKNGDYKIFKEEYIETIPECRAFNSTNLNSDPDFEPGFEYLFPEVSLTLLHDTYVSRSGAVCTGEDEVIEETLEADIGANFDQPLSAYDALETVTAASKFGNFNHAIFTMETLPLVVLSQMDAQAAEAPRPLYFERDYCNEAFVAEHLSLIAALDLRGTRIERDVRAARCFVPAASRRNGSFRATALSHEVATRMRAVAPAIAGLPQRIYVSRRHAPSRIPRQIDAMERIALERGYTPVHLEHMNPMHQMALFANCEAIMAEHGAGLANLQYALPGCRVLELFPSAMYRKWVFRLTAHCAGALYSTGEFPVEDGWVYNSDGVDIDLALFHRCLDHLDAG